MGSGKDALEKAGHILAHQAMQSAGCMVTLIAMLTGVGTLFTIIGLVFFA